MSLLFCCSSMHLFAPVFPYCSPTITSVQFFGRMYHFTLNAHKSNIRPRIKIVFFSSSTFFNNNSANGKWMKIIWFRAINDKLEFLHPKTIKRICAQWKDDLIMSETERNVSAPKNPLNDSNKMDEKWQIFSQLMVGFFFSLSSLLSSTTKQIIWTDESLTYYFPNEILCMFRKIHAISHICRKGICAALSK